MKRALALPAVLVLTLGLAACGEDDTEPTDSSSSSEASESESPSEADSPTEADSPSESSAAAGGDCTYTADGQEPARPVETPPATPEYTEPTEAVITTSNGDVRVTLAADTAPCTVNSFVSLAEQGFYDDTPCPRITTDPGFELLQCGDPTGTTGGGPGYQFDDELTGSETYGAGTLAMANAGPNTNGSQFFIVYGDTGLSPDYTVFGQVAAEDLSVIEEIAADGDDGSNPAGGGAPNTPISIESVSVG